MIDKYDIGYNDFNKILERVHGVDYNYSNRFGALKERLVAFQTKIIKVAAMITPDALNMDFSDYVELSYKIQRDYNNARDVYDYNIEKLEKSTPLLEDSSTLIKVKDYALGVAVSTAKDGLDALVFFPQIMVNADGRQYEDNLDRLEGHFTDIFVSDKESYYSGRVTSDIVLSINGLSGAVGSSIASIIPAAGSASGGITLGGGTLALEGASGVAIGVAVPVVAAVAVGVSISVAAAGNLKDDKAKLNEIKDPNYDVNKIRKPELSDDLKKVADDIKGGRGSGSGIKSTDLIFGSNTKSAQKLINQMNSRGWTETIIKDIVDSPYTVRVSINKATGNLATVFYTKQGSYVIVDDITNEIVQISDNINPSTWVPDTSIINPYKPE